MHPSALWGLAALLTEPLPQNSCIEAWTEARYRAYGYDHVVHIQNGCAYDALCVVSTNVRPQPQEIDVDSGQHVEVLTFKASPWRTFTAKVTCTEI
jgi:hypothetical protein